MFIHWLLRWLFDSDEITVRTIKKPSNDIFKGIRFLFATGNLNLLLVDNRNILVIGAGGQLGSELTQALRQRYGENNVIATDIKNPGGLAGQGRFEILDVLDQKLIAEIL